MDDWLSIAGNEEPWSRLLELLKSDEAVAFVGAGASAGLYPTWTALIDKLVDRAGALGVDSQILDFWRKMAASAPLETVEVLERELGPGRFIESLAEIFSPPPSDPAFTPTHEALLRLPFKALVTTNYDLGLSNARGHVHGGVQHSLPFTWRDADVSRWLDGKLLGGTDLPILHAHGLVKDPESLILSARAYRHAYSEGPWSLLFSQLWRQGSLVTVGFSLSDPWIAVLADQALTAAGIRDVVAPGHVAILGLPEEQKALAREHRELSESKYHSQILFYPVKQADDGRQDHSALLRLLAASLKQLTSDSTPDQTATAVKPADGSGAPDSLAAYRRWADQRYGTIDLIGLGAGHLKLPLDKVYVPLRFRSTGREHRLLGADLADRLAAEPAEADSFVTDEDLELDQLFRRHDERLVVVFGEPGMGKTTALQKLHQLTLTGAEDLGLTADTVPVFLRLRRLTPEKLAEPLESFIESEVQILSGGKHAGVGAKLWAHGRLLLLFDGLDEIADEKHRAEVCHDLERQLAAAPAGVRAVISCRNVGWSDVIKKTTLAAEALPVEVKPFDDRQIAVLVEQWFLAAANEISSYSPAQARVDSRQLATALEQEKQQQFKSLISTPQLLTLLCVVVRQGGEIPRQRVEFFEKCVNVLLTWRRQAGQRPPVEAGQLLRVLAEIGIFLHEQHDRDTLKEPKAAELIAGVVPLDKVEPVWHWLRYEAGLLRRFSERDFGFLHLHVQEYAAALALAEDEKRLADACADWVHDEGSWWQEVFQLLVALPGRATFAPLAKHLLTTAAPVQRADLLASCLREASDPDLRPILEVLRRREPAQQSRDAALLRLMQGRKDQALLELAQELASQGPKVIQTEADYVLQLASGASQRDCHVALIHHPDDHRIAKRLRRYLEQGSLSVYRTAEGRVWTDVRELMAIVKKCQTAVLLVGSRPVEPENLNSFIRLTPEMTRQILVLPADPPPEIPEGFSQAPPIEITGFDNRHLREVVSAYRSSLETPEPPTSEPEVSLKRRLVATRSAETRTKPVSSGHARRPTGIGDIWQEPLTGMELLTVPAGGFEMGSTNSKQTTPVHRVEVSEFLLGRTPVTNREYAVFLKATSHREPKSWRDRKYSAERQPVIGVDWSDCVAFCEWLTREANDETRFTLPTEAQWEYAARGTESFRYPWGGAKPDGKLASFKETSKDRPPKVGSFPAGAGPFGHLDLAGTVWEWCLDEWEDSYQRRVDAEELLDPIGKGDVHFRPLRGGSWASDAQFLESAIRIWFEPANRDPFFGFRVVAAPARLAP